MPKDDEFINKFGTDLPNSETNSWVLSSSPLLGEGGEFLNGTKNHRPIPMINTSKPPYKQLRVGILNAHHGIRFIVEVQRYGDALTRVRAMHPMYWSSNAYVYFDYDKRV